MSHPPDHIKAIASTAELLAALEAFEGSGCNFGGATNAYIRAVHADPHRETFTYGGMTFEAATYPRTVLILTHVAKPDPANPDAQTLRPFGRALVEHGVRQVRLVAPSAYTAWVEVQRGVHWQRVRPEAPSPEAPSPTPPEEAAHVDHP